MVTHSGERDSERQDNRSEVFSSQSCRTCQRGSESTDHDSRAQLSHLASRSALHDTHAVHREDEQSRCGDSTASSWRSPPKVLGHPGTSCSAERDRGGEWHSKDQGQTTDRSSDLGHQAEQSKQEEGNAEDLLHPRLGNDLESQSYHPGDAASSHDSDLRRECGISDGPHGLWDACQQELWRGVPGPSQLCHLGNPDHGGGAVINPAEPVCTMVPEGEDQAGQCSGQDNGPSQLRDRARHHSIAASDPRDDDNNGTSHDHLEARDGEPQGRTASEEERLRDEQLWNGVGERRALSDSETSAVARKFTKSLAQYVEREAESILPKAFSSLIQKGPTILVEVACAPESRISQAVQDHFGYEAAAKRCSHWNGCDLSTDAGVRLTLDVIDRHKPTHVWISTECGPYSPMQAINQRSPQQVAELETKRKAALRQYIGGSCVLHHCIQNGIHVHWEWAEKCQAWRLPFIQRIQKKYEPYMCVTNGCRVNLRDPKTQGLLHKGWKVMTTMKRMQELLDLPCRCSKGYRHAKCEGGLARMSAYYTKEFAQRVALAMEQNMTTTQIHQEFNGKTTLVKQFGEGLICNCEELKDHGSRLQCSQCSQHDIVSHSHDHGTPKRDGKEPQSHEMGNSEMAMVSGKWDMDQTEEDIKKKLYLLHAATGHGSVRNMVHALQKRGASPKVMELAKKFKCSLCEEKRHVNHKQAASLEPLPPKLATVAADGGHWYHPTTGEHSQFALIIDEGSRFRVGRVLKTGKHQTMKASEFLNYFREGWIQYFGKPMTLRLDPAGAFRSHEVESFCDEQSILLDVIPGEAHWQLGTCEQAIHGVKEIMTKLVERNPEMTAQGALEEATRVFNHREMVRGFSPVQHLLGQAPDETGRFVASVTGQTFEKLIENPHEGIQLSINRMRDAEQALSEWQAKQRIGRALNSRPQKMIDYRPGDLVYFWRKQLKKQGVGKNGAFLGPARILAMETHKDDQGVPRPSRSIWCVRGRRLLKCSPEQLRPASAREELLWTI